MIYDYIVIGGGISGVTAARLLQLSGVERMCVLEAAAQPGGLCRTVEVDGHVLDLGGGHFLCSRFPEVYAFIFAHLPQSAFNHFERISRIALRGHEVDYPLESNIWQLPPELCVDFLISAIQNGEARGAPAPANFAAWIRWKLGDRIADEYMLPYNRKIWGVEPSEMDLDWLHKLPRLDLHEIALACLRRRADPAAMPSHVGFFYPKMGGFQRIFDAIAAPLGDRIHCGTRVDRIEREGDVLVVNGRFRARKIINTAPWHGLAHSPVVGARTRHAIQQLRANQLVVSLHEETYTTPAHWLYEPDETLARHRTFFIHNFAPHSRPGGLFRETNARRWQADKGELCSHLNEHAYPIPTLGWAQAAAAVLADMAAQGIHGVGRWGQWQYFNSDVCIHEVMQLMSRLGHDGWRAGLKGAG